MAEEGVKLKIEQLRLNPHYLIWYKNVATFLVSLLLPLCLLAYWNYNTNDVLNRRRRLRNRPYPDKNLEELDLALFYSDQPTGVTHSVGSTLPSIAATVMLNPLYYEVTSMKSSVRQEGRLSLSQQGLCNSYLLEKSDYNIY